MHFIEQKINFNKKWHFGTMETSDFEHIAVMFLLLTFLNK